MSDNNRIIDMSQIPPPDVVRPVDFEATVAQMKADIIADVPEAAAVLALESATLTKFVERAAYWLVNRAQMENEDAHAVMLPYAHGADLDQLGALFQVQRLVITPGDDTTIPPTPAVMESDMDFRYRIQLATSSFSTAGPVNAYRYYTLSASGQVLDTDISSPLPGDVVVTVLSREGDGSPSTAVLQAVQAALNDEDVRPLTDHVIVQAAQIVPYTITAKIHILNGPDTGLVMQQVQQSIAAYTQNSRSVGHGVPLSGIYAALHLNGVDRVELTSPAGDVAIGAYQAPYCENIGLEMVPAKNISDSGNGAEEGSGG